MYLVFCISDSILALCGCGTHSVGIRSEIPCRFDARCKATAKEFTKNRTIIASANELAKTHGRWFGS